MHTRSIVALLLVASVFAAARTLSQEVAVPQPLEAWRDWVLYGEEYRACPVLSGRAPGQTASHVCAWPGTLAVDVSANGAQFTQTWTLYADEWVPLPGSAELWPAGVTVDGTPEAVVARNGRPMLRLERGTHRIAGSIAFTTRPASIPIPAESGLVTLRLDGQNVARPDVERGALWLGLRADAEIEEDRLDIVVHRRIVDELPMRIETRIELDIAGQVREIALEGAAIDGFVPERLEAELPAQLNANGVLRVQVRPGSHEITLWARAAAPPSTITRPSVTEPWPADEIWSFAPEPRLRVAALEGAEAVDAGRSGVPGEWYELAAYRVTAGQTVTVAERSRNDAADPNRLSLRRDLWLDFDGGGFTARDSVTGRMSSRWRLDMAAPYTMTMASIGDDNLLVTAGSEAGVQGVELRMAELDLTTTARIERMSRLPVTGYAETFDDVSTVVHMPPGYRVLAAPGADRVGGVWLERWSLLDIFLVLIVTTAVWRLFGTAGGVIALLALVLTFHEPAAPRWAWLNLLVAIALVRVAPEGRLATFAGRYRWLSVAGVVLFLIPFTIGQLRTALHPQLEWESLGRGVAFEQPALGFSVFDEAAAPQRSRALEQSALEEITVTGSRIGGELERYQPGALVQTGPGLPDWTWTQYSLGFSGPVDAEQSFRLVLLGPWLTALWRVASVALALALLWVLVGRVLRLPPGLLRGGSTVGAALVFLVAPNSGDAQPLGEFPSQALLDELKSRLTRPAACHPSCAELGTATVTVADDVLTVELEVALQAPVAVPVPSLQRGWILSTVNVDGAAAGVLYRDSAQTAWLPLGAGVRRVTLRGPLVAARGVSLPFPLPPRRIAVTAPGWDVTGVSDGRLRSGTLELTRQQTDEAADGDDTGSVRFAPFVSVTRRIEFDLDWQVTTTVTREAPDTGAFTLVIDLLPNEAVLTPGIDAANGSATVAFAPDDEDVQWQSRLPTAETLTLTAPTGAAWSERWVFAVGQIWHAEYAGVPSTAPEDAFSALYTPEFYPRPGETLTVSIRRPEPASGDTIAIDTVDYYRKVGARASESTLELTYRSTRADEHVITLPEGSELDSVWIDGDPVPLELDGTALGIPVTPGEHSVEIEWRNAGGVGVWTSVPPVDLGRGASNIETELDLPADRWVLLTTGPTLGPAILYWTELLAMIVAAVVLGRLSFSPLRTHEWLLLGLGLSTFAWPVLALFAVWAFAMRWRERAPRLPVRWQFNGVQIALGVLTVSALVAVIGAIPAGLLGRPNMHVVSPVEFGSLSWFVDRTPGPTPESGVLSVSLWFYKAAMLAWALWLSFALLRWLPWAWRAFSHDGIWQRRERKPAAASGPA